MQSSAGNKQAVAPRRQAAALVPIVVYLDHRDRLADDEPVRRQGDIVLEGLPERPQLLVVVVGVDGDLLDQMVQIGGAPVIACGSAHRSPSTRKLMGDSVPSRSRPSAATSALPARRCGSSAASARGRCGPPPSSSAGPSG